MVFLDESGIDTFLYKEYGRAKRGEKIMAEVSGKKFERQSVVAAQCGNETLAPFGYHGTCNAKLFNFWQKWPNTQPIRFLRSKFLTQTRLQTYVEKWH